VAFLPINFIFFGLNRAVSKMAWQLLLTDKHHLSFAEHADSKGSGYEIHPNNISTFSIIL
jgi:hypothetical protein